MKTFAIIPEKFSAERVVNSLPDLIKSRVHYLYLRGMTNRAEITELVEEINKTGIIPVVSFKGCPKNKELVYGIHYKSTEIDHIAEKQPGCAIVTASAHDADTAKDLLGKGVDYVYVSPVFKPLSKESDCRELFPRDRIISLTREFGERVVLLGGLTRDRIEQLRKSIKDDFSVAGITLFFGCQKTMVKKAIFTARFAQDAEHAEKSRC
jgi:thiamine monophosphate synthase